MKKILIIEDEGELNEAYRMVLSSAGYKTFSAFNGEEGLSVAAMEQPDLILLDLRMPVMDGIEFLRNFDANNKSSKIIVFSNYDLQKEIDVAHDLGADRYVLKAMISPRELVQLVERSFK